MWDEIRSWGTLAVAALAAVFSLVQLVRNSRPAPAFTLSIWNEDDYRHDASVLHGDLRNVGPGDARSLRVTVTRQRGKWWRRERTKWEIDGTVDTLLSHTAHQITLGAEGSVFDEDAIPYKRGDTYWVLVTYYASHSSRKRRKRLRAAFTSKTKNIENF